MARTVGLVASVFEGNASKKASRRARDRVGLAADIGLRGLHAGPIANSAAAEALTAILISMNKRYKVPGNRHSHHGLPARQPR